jgi:hypothetical protein
MRFNDLVFLRDTIGMPMEHLRAFLTASTGQKCVIMVRATGPTCNGPLAEGYDTKGYRIHGKSCDWGPMAGFVMRDPRLNKYGMGKAKFNREKHDEALNLDHEGQGWKASSTPLKISDQRVAWLTGQGIISPVAKGGRMDGMASHPSGVKFYYSLIRDLANPALWGVYFDNTRIGQKWMQEKGSTVVYYHPKWGPSYEPMLAMTNPPDYRQFPGENYKNAITGDYDLFAVWPFSGQYNPNPYGDDHRPLGTVKGSVGQDERDNVDHLERNFTVGGQGTKLGNITPRIYFICQLINSIVGRHVLWHSDEAARPYLDDVDLPVLAMTPAGNHIGIENILDFKAFISFCLREGIHVSLSNAWTQNPAGKFQNRLGADYAHLVPPDGQRIIVPNWYNG